MPVFFNLALDQLLQRMILTNIVVKWGYQFYVRRCAKLIKQLLVKSQTKVMEHRNSGFSDLTYLFSNGLSLVASKDSLIKRLNLCDS